MNRKTFFLNAFCSELKVFLNIYVRSLERPGAQVSYLQYRNDVINNRLICQTFRLHKINYAITFVQSIKQNILLGDQLIKSKTMLDIC